MNQGGRRLLLLRHAKAVAPRPGAPDASDHARALSERGRLDASALGRLLRDQALTPALALVSSALRTRQTFELLGLGSGPDAPHPTLSDALYLADPETLLDVLREQDPGLASIMLVGHNPGMHELAVRLAEGNPVLAQGFPTCTLAVFAIEGDWAGLGPGRSRLLEILRGSAVASGIASP